MTDPVIISVHKFRRTARKKERALTAGMVAMRRSGVSVAAPGGFYRLPIYGAPHDLIPVWARGFRVEHAGPFQWAVVATEHRGH